MSGTLSVETVDATLSGTFSALRFAAHGACLCLFVPTRSGLVIAPLPYKRTCALLNPGAAERTGRRHMALSCHSANEMMQPSNNQMSDSEPVVL